MATETTKKFPWLWVILGTLLIVGVIVGYAVYKNKGFLNTTAPANAGTGSPANPNGLVVDKD